MTTLDTITTSDGRTISLAELEREATEGMRGASPPLLLALVHEVRRLREALRPFAEEVNDFTATRGADGWDGEPAECPLHLFSRCWNGNRGATVGDCLRAAALLQGGRES